VTIFKRTRTQAVKVAFNLAVVVTVAIWSIFDGLRGSTIMLWFGIGFAVWSLYIACNLFRRQTHVVVNDDGMTVHKTLGSATRIGWSQINSVSLQPGRIGGWVKWRDTPDATIQIAFISQVLMGEEAAGVLRGIVFGARPDLVNAA
jgi:hypothetical protein